MKAYRVETTYYNPKTCEQKIETRYIKASAAHIASIVATDYSDYFTSNKWRLISIVSEEIEVIEAVC